MAPAPQFAATKLPAVEWKGLATRRTTRPSAKVPTTRQCSSLPRQSRIALETSLPLKTGAQFFVRQSSITNRTFAIALEHGRFNSSVGQLLVSMFPNGVASGQFLARVFSHRHPANGPCVECHIDGIRQRRIGDVFFLQKGFHQFRRLTRSAQDCEALPRLPGQSISRDCAVVIDAQKQIFLRARADLGKKQPRQKGRTINLLERTLHYRAERVMRETPQGNVRCRTRETLVARQFDCRHAQPLDIAGMADRAHRDPVVNLKNLLPRAPKRHEKNSVTISDCRDRTAGRKLCFDILAPVRDRFYPTIWFFDHATLCRKTCAIFSSGNVVIPSRETVLISGKIFPLR